MGKIKNPMQIHWTNNVGGVVGFHAYGNHYWRANAQSVANPNTLPQRNVRGKFTVITQLISTLVPAYKVGYKEYAQGRSPRAEFYHQIDAAGAITGSYTDGYTIDYEKVKIARGSLLPTFGMTATVLGVQHKVSFSWTDNSGQGDAEGTDKLCVCLLNQAKATCVFVETAGTRSSESAQVTYPAAWAGDTVQTFVFWRKTGAKSYNSESNRVSFFVAE